MKTIDLTLFKGACHNQLAVVKREWPGGVPISRSSIDRARNLELDIGWLVSHLLFDDSWASTRLKLGKKLEHVLFNAVQWLDLSNTQVTDASLKELAGLKQLRTLNLSNTQVTDAGLKELAGLKQLQTLYLYRAQVTDAGVRKLKKALPIVTIYR